MNIIGFENIKMWGVTCSCDILLAHKNLLAGSSGWGSILELCGTLLIFCLILVAAVWVTKLIGTKATGLQNRNIKVIETYRISNNSAIQIIRVADKYMAVAISKESINLIAQLDEDSVIVSEPTDELSSIQFGELLSKAKDKIKKAKSQK